MSKIKAYKRYTFVHKGSKNVIHIKAHTHYKAVAGLQRMIDKIEDYSCLQTEILTDKEAQNA